MLAKADRSEEQRHIDKNPLAKFKKPKAVRRETVISPEDFARILGKTRRSSGTADYRN